MMANMSVLTTRKAEKKDVGALAGLRAIVTEEPIEPASPYNTLIKTNRPTFTWIPRKTYDKYIVNLYSSKGLVWSREVSGSYLNFPENEKSLDFGETYFWNVEGEDILDNKKSSSFKFSVLSTEKSKEILDQEALIRKTFDNDSDSSSLHSFLGAYYINQGLFQDAINEFLIISGMNPDAPLPHEILGSLYSDAGNKDKAIEELQKALALAKNKDK
jgi:tetratricopeptide (TPR) repeat protein